MKYNVSKRSWLIVVGVLIIGISVKVVCGRLNAVHAVTVAVDSRLATDVQKKVVAFVHENTVHKKLSAPQLFAQLQQQFPCVQSLTAHFCAPGVLHCEVEAATPLVVLNNKQVVMENNQLFARELYADRSVRFLYNVTQDAPQQTMHIAPQFAATMHKLLPGIFTEYHVQWIDDKQVKLLDKTQPDFTIICSATKVPDQKMLAQCNKLKSDIEQTQLLEKKPRKQQWTADIRFENQIILVGEKGGLVNG